jgi:hypothetical protein
MATAMQEHGGMQIDGLQSHKQLWLGSHESPGMEHVQVGPQAGPVDVELIAVVLDALVVVVLVVVVVIVPVVTVAVTLPVVVPTVETVVVATEVVIAPPPPLRLQFGFASLHIIGGGVSGTHTLLTHVDPGEHTTPVHDTSSWMGS